MWEMILPYLNELEPGEALRQFREWFPEGIEETPASDLKTKYDTLASAIITDKDHGLIKEFRKDITANQRIREGKHFNLQHLIAAYQAYIDHFKAFDTWENRDLFLKKVIGYVQRQMTAYDAQIHCSDLRNVLDKEFSFNRTLILENGVKFFPLGINSGLGFSFACYGASARSYVMFEPWALEGFEKLTVHVLKNYVEQKQLALAELKESLEQGMSYPFANR
jgi:hypothetical protein